MRLLFLTLLLPLLTACNTYHLRYPADPQPKGVHLYADFSYLHDTIGVSVDTDGRRLEEIYIQKPDGTTVLPLTIAYPPFGKTASVGVGVGVGSWPVGVGTGVSTPVGPDRALGPTTATFPTAALGPPPWQLHLKVDGHPATVIPNLGGPAK